MASCNHGWEVDYENPVVCPECQGDELKQLHAGIAALEETLRSGGMLANCISGMRLLLFDGSDVNETGGDHLVDIINQLGQEGT